MSSQALLFAFVAGVLTVVCLLSSTPFAALVLTNVLLGLIAGQLMIRRKS